MCGIAGQLDWGARVSPRRICDAAHRIRHRGPNGEGYLLVHMATGEYALRNGPDTPPGIDHPPIDAPAPFAPDLVLAHRRLSILDLSPAGHEPMRLAGRDDLWITFNGELYNYLEIRAELAAAGRVFTTECDVEVLLHAYDAWGTDCLHRFRGMFAFALWDGVRRRLWCARDRFGIKPFYYAHTGTRFSFASEMKAFPVLAPEACTPDDDHVLWALQFNAVFNPPHTFFTGVRELAGGHSLIVDIDGAGGGRVGEPTAWYTMLPPAPNPASEAANAAALREHLEATITLHLRSDVPVGTCLSGGLDSSSIAGLANRELRAAGAGPLNSFSVVYPVAGYDESRFVHLAAGHFGTVSHTATPHIDGDYLAQLRRIVYMQDIPIGVAGLLSQNTVMALAAPKVTVLLDGQGSDELFGGYLSHAVHYYRTMPGRDPLRLLREFPVFAVQAWQRYLPGFTLREFAARAAHLIRHGREARPILTAEATARAFAREALRAPRHLAGAEPLNDRLYQSLVQLSVPALLHYEDRSSMSYSIEARVPFLDHLLAEFALSIPAAHKIAYGEGKRVLRAAMADVLPPAITHRRDKLGYPTPFAQWSRTTLREPIRALLEEAVYPRPGLDAAHLRGLWAQHQAGQINADRLFHNLVTSAFWYEQFGTTALSSQ